MEMTTSSLNIPVWVWIYGVPLLLIMAVYLGRRVRQTRHSHSIHLDAVQAGLTEPASLHPVIDPTRCLGCAACVSACPEKNVLGIINGKARLIGPSHCIGHGACHKACPFSAITLVFGTEKRGVDIPMVKPNFETNVPGIFIAGELGGMGLIRNAIRQGTEAMESISKLDGVGKGEELDVIIVGAGPTGIAASLAAMKHKLRFITLEQDSFGGTVSHYPRGKVVMTAPGELPIIGKFHFRETTKESLMEFWEGIKEKTGLEIKTHEGVDKINPQENGFEVTTSKGTYRSRAVLLSIGRRGTPRKLGVPGEEHSKVVYRLIDPEQYSNQKVLIVGGGDSALEAAISIAEAPGTCVTISYRSEAFNRAKPKNRDKILQYADDSRLQLLMSSTVKTITPAQVMLDQGGKDIVLDNDAIIVSAGGILPTPFLKSIGIEVETKFGTV